MLQKFLQCNFIGPLIPQEELRRQEAIEYLCRLSGEDIQPKIYAPELLMDALESDLSTLEKAQALYMAQVFSFQLSDNIKNMLLPLLDQVADTPDNQLFKVQVYVLYGMIDDAQRELDQLVLARGFQFRVTGAYGKKQQQQVKETAQLKVIVEQSEVYQPTGSVEFPRNIALESNSLNQEVQWSDEANERHLHPLDQCILLAQCKIIRASNADDNLSKEQIQPYVQRLLIEQSVSSIQQQALLLRSWIQIESSKTVERSLFQVQEIVESFSQTTSDDYFWQVCYPSHIETRKQLAKQLVSLGAVKSAYEIYSALESWDEAIDCLVVTDQVMEAEQLIDNQLEKGPSARLLCIKGDLKKDPSFWEQAWEQSGQRYARAMRSLGGWYYNLGKFDLSVECYKKAMALNSLFEQSWFTLGCAAMQVQDWNEAQVAFQRCIQIEPSNGEAWNNLAAVNLQLGRKRDAYNCLKEAVKEKYDNWKLWENLLFIGLDIGEFPESIRAYQRLLAIRWKNSSCQPDVEALRTLIMGSYNLVKELGSKGTLLHRVEALLQETTMAHPYHVELWQLYAEYHQLLDNQAQVLHGLQSGYRSVMQSALGDTVDHNEEAFCQVASKAIRLANQYSNCQDLGIAVDGRHQAKLILKSLLRRTQEAFEDHPLYQQLADCLVTTTGR